MDALHAYDSSKQKVLVLYTLLDLVVLEATCGYVQEPFNVARDGQDPFKALYGFHFRFDTTSLACHATRQALRWWKRDDFGAKEDGS